MNTKQYILWKIDVYEMNTNGLNVYVPTSLNTFKLKQ